MNTQTHRPQKQDWYYFAFAAFVIVIIIVAIGIVVLWQDQKRYEHESKVSVRDIVLKNVAAVFKAGVRTGDYCIRWGGEEFLIVLPGCSAEIASGLAERIRMAIENQNHGDVGKVTMSFGVAEWNKSESVDALINRSDQALYEAKHTGRNRVVVATAERVETR